MRMVPRIDIDLVIELVNEYSAATRAAAGEAELAYPKLQSLVRLDATTEEAIAAADSLFTCFELAAHQKHAAFIQALNGLIIDTRLSSRLDEAGNLGWVQPDSGPLVMGAAVGSLVCLVNDSGAGRIGSCSAKHCVDVYADHSRGGQRRYCSEACGTRSRVARWRRQDS